MNLRKSITVVIIFLVAALLFARYLERQKEKPPSEDSNLPKPAEVSYANASADLIQVELPYPGAVVGKKFSVIGRARGNWFFEASFPVTVLDKEGKILVQHYAMAQADPATGEVNWMTTEFVLFRGDLVIPEHYIGPATLLLMKDNPSGLPEYDASISFPIVIEY